jgi:porin
MCMYENNIGKRIMKTFNTVLKTTMILLLFGPSLAMTADNEDNIWNRDKLFGDVGGARTVLGERGVDVEVRLNQYYQDVTEGGANENSEYGGHLDYIVNVDGEKFGLWKGLFLNLHAEYQYGDSILADAGGLSFNNTTMLYPEPGDTATEVTGWSVTQGLYQKGDTAIALTAGKIHVVDLLNQAWPFLEMGKNGFMNYNVNVPVAPLARYIQLSHLGTGLLVFHKTDIKAAIAVLDTHNASTTSGFNKLGDNGLTAVGLYRFFFDVKDMPGKLTFMASTSTGEYTTFEDTVYHIPLKFGPRRTLIFNVPGLVEDPERNPWTAMAYYDQIVWQGDPKGERNVRFVAAGSIADQNPSFANWQYSGQVVATGLFDSRPLDKIGIGGYYVGINSRVKDTSATSPLLPDLGDYSGFEFFYSAAITPAIHLTGDLQITDSFEKVNDTAIIPGMRLSIEF